jgi:hypothetical protein
MALAFYSSILVLQLVTIQCYRRHPAKQGDLYQRLLRRCYNFALTAPSLLVTIFSSEENSLSPFHSAEMLAFWCMIWPVLMIQKQLASSEWENSFSKVFFQALAGLTSFANLSWWPSWSLLSSLRSSVEPYLGSRLVRCFTVHFWLSNLKS